MKKGVKIASGVAGAVLVLGVIGYVAGPGRDVQTLWKHGVIQSVVDDQGADRKYAASRQENLKAIYIALELFQNSEGQYPDAKGWMDAIQKRLHTNDMTNEEAEKKLIRPNLISPQPNQYGYAINDAAAGRFKGDIKDNSTPLIFESTDLTKNAHGSPAGLKGKMAITVGGKIVTL